ncbi:hypothetical protein SAMN05421760_101698 [Neptunomonas antarctica]|uniref:Uncharacterized protein n=1 Tax=Neptunomonas antarctica TaxID=619304 RepID=A0A1N7J6X4_9GAMM|nr:hypothetical protein SAMN05421760_101698 [Neptunomonas antarctica]
MLPILIACTNHKQEKQRVLQTIIRMILMRMRLKGRLNPTLLRALEDLITGFDQTFRQQFTMRR